MSAFGTVLKHTLNRVTTRVAMGRGGPFALVRHIGRRSGTSYATPIIVQPAEGGFVIELTYGDGVDWYRIAAFSPAEQRILRLLRRDHFVTFLTN